MRETFHLSKGYQKPGFCHLSEKGEVTAPYNYCMHVSLLHAKVVIIIDTSAKRQLTWGNGKDAERGLADVGLHVK